MTKEDWAEKAIQDYTELACDKDIDLAFYQQTPLSRVNPEKVKVVIMGINPGSGSSFQDQKNSELWTLQGGIENNPQHLLRGNPRWNNPQDPKWPWPYVRKTLGLLRPTFGEIDTQLDTICVFTNATFFNTRREYELKNQKKIYEITVLITMQLIDEVLKPEIVVCLSGLENFKRIKNYTTDTFKYRKVFDNAFLVGKRNGTTYIGIYHTAFRYSKPLTALVKEAIMVTYDHVSENIDSLTDILLSKCGALWLDVLNGNPTPSTNGLNSELIMSLLGKFKEWVYATFKPCDVVQNAKWTKVWLSSDVYFQLVAQSNSFVRVATQNKDSSEWSQIVNILSKFAYDEGKDGNLPAMIKMSTRYANTLDEFLHEIKSELESVKDIIENYK